MDKKVKQMVLKELMDMIDGGIGSNLKRFHKGKRPEAAVEVEIEAEPVKVESEDPMEVAEESAEKSAHPEGCHCDECLSDEDKGILERLAAKKHGE